jgi:cell division protein FtsB
MATQTMPRTPGTPRQAPGRAAPPRDASPRPHPVSSPRHTRPVARPRAPRMAFILLLVGLLGGALVSLLVISTTLAAGSFRITSLKQQNANLAQQEQALADQVAQLSSQAQIAREARQLGMRQDPYLRFINLKTGKVVTGRATKSEAAIHVPGFTP